MANEPNGVTGSSVSTTDRPPPGGVDRARPNADPVPFEGRAPRSAGLAGILFSILFLAYALLVGARPPAGLTEAGLLEWFDQTARGPITLGTLYVAPFAGIAFLWFLAVIRARVGEREDRLFATVFLGSGLLFVAMFWASAAALASLITANPLEGAPPLGATTLETFRSLSSALLFTIGSRAAGVFMLVASTIGLRTATFPPWLVVTGYVIALVMLLSLSLHQWIVLLFPAWVFVTSVYILNSEVRAMRSLRGDPPAA